MAIAVKPADTADLWQDGRISLLYAALQQGMLRKQGVWRPASVLEDPGVADLPLLTRRAMTVARVLEQMPIEILDDELIVGKASINGHVQKIDIPPHYSSEERAQGDGSMTIRLSHKTPYYPDVVNRGFADILAEIAIKKAEKAAEEPSAKRDEALLLYEAMEIEVQGVIALAHRYAELAENTAAVTADPKRQAELRQIAKTCRRVPEFSARTFQEALQSVWMTHFALFSTNTKISLGRIDQFCGPFLDADLESGRLTMDEARELLASFWIKFSERDQLLRENFIAENPEEAEPWKAGSRTRHLYYVDRGDAVNHWGQNVLLSGITPEGADGTNTMTYLVIECIEKLKTTQPVVAVRLHKHSPVELIEASARALKAGGAMPLIFNDEALIPAYTRLGVSLEDARDYGDSNCWETMIAGKSDQEIIRGVNFLLILEWVFNRGLSRIRNTVEGIDTGDPLAFRSFDELIDAWKRQLDSYISDQVDFIGSQYFDCTLLHSSHGKYAYNPLLSTMVKDCIEKGEDVIRGGARYIMWHMGAEAVANTTDALAAIKKFVYEDKTVTMQQLIEAMDRNWEGYESLRQAIISRGAKFANDDPTADAICREMMDAFVDSTNRHAARYPGILFPAMVGTFSWYTSIGKEVDASADGRLKADPVTSNFSPAFGADRNGPTAAIKSYSQMRMSDLAAGAPTDLRFSASELKGEAGTHRLAAYIRSFIEMGGNMMTITVTDAAILRAAMADPMKYRSLRVRMGGWSAYWCVLSPEQQRNHLAKVEHGLA